MLHISSGKMFHPSFLFILYFYVLKVLLDSHFQVVQISCKFFKLFNFNGLELWRQKNANLRK